MKRLFGRLGALATRAAVSSTMDITKGNFTARLPEIEAAIDSAIFLAIDGEFTGLNADKGNSAFDLPAERYSKVQESASQFLLVQFGLATFHYDPAKDQFSHRAYNVYVWPRPVGRGAPDRRFLSQTSSIDFLIGQGFDFNKLFKEGVSYLLPSELDKLKEGLKERQENKRRLSQVDQSENLKVRVPEEQEEWLEKQMAAIEQFLKTGGQESFLMDKCNGFQRRLVYQTARERFPDTSLSSIANEGGDRVIQVMKADKDQQARIALESDQAEMDNLEGTMGFTRVIQKIAESGKLVVGHNMLLDVAFTLNQFAAPLPTDYSEFKALAASVLPRVMDTKLMANTAPLRQEIVNSSLEELLRTASLPPYEMPEVPAQEGSCGYSDQSERYHEAGYDAMITGRCFLSLCQRLGRLAGSGGSGRILPNSPLLQPYLNKVHLMRVQDIPYMDLGGADLKPSRDHVFHLRFPKEWKTHDLKQLFQERYGDVQVAWIDDTQAFVALRDKEQAGQVLSCLSGSPTFTIQTWEEFQKSKVIDKNLQHCGATPIMEKTQFLSPQPKLESNGKVEEKESKKRSTASSNGREVKRQRSTAEDKGKAFEEPEWE